MNRRRDRSIPAAARGRSARPAPGGWPELSLAGLAEGLRMVLAARPRQALVAEDRIPAAVLVLFVERSGQVRLVFTQKTDTVPHHQGQFAFPGGLVAQADRSRVETALREAREEIALPSTDVEVLGLLDDTPTGSSRFVITPVVGLARSAPPFRPDGREIARVVEIPVASLLDPGAFREERWERDGRRYPVVFFTHGPDVVWGATGRIVRDLWDRLFPGWRG